MNEDLTQFSYAASHDLKEPLRQVALYAELLSNDYRGKLDDTAQLYLGFCLEGARRMLDLVRGLSAYVGIDKSDGQGGASADAGAVLEIVRRNLGEAIAESATTLTAGPLPRVAVREAHLIQLFQNVIDNAIKYRHPARTAVISVSADRSDGEWTFSVKDNGIGIDSRYYGQIFKVFKRLQRHTPGTGIGLAMCQRIVERYNGRIWVQSEPEAGSTFFFTLPAEN
jgi:light-regulated signal transduction histidine kinase (bacteriophytochrome)